MLKSINKVIKVIIVYDFFLNSAWGLLAPIFAIFIVRNITVGDPLVGARVAGFASLIYWMTKSLLQIPIGKYLDRNHGEKDDLWFAVTGTFLAGLVPLGYLISTQPWHIYLCQVLYAVGMSMVIPSAYSIFVRHIDKGKEAFEWGTDSTFLGFGVGVTGALGGVISSIFGFRVILIVASFLTILSASLMLLIRKEMTSKDKTIHEIPPSKIF
jgi:MFS family permease